MADAAAFPAAFERLKTILATYAPQLLVKTDNENVYYLDTAVIQPNKTPLFFAATQIKKSYVSFYLFPVYVFPELLADLSPALRKRMQGKSCFNFTKVEEPLLEELARLTAAGFQKFEQEQMLR